MATNEKKFSDGTFYKVLITIVVILLSIFFVFGLIGRGIQVIIKNQQKRVDKLMSKLILSKVVNNEKDFKRIANYKSKVFFFKHSIPPILMMLICLLTYIICISIHMPMHNGEYVSMFYLFGRVIYPWQGEFNYYPPLGFDFSNVHAVLPFGEYSTWYIVLSIIVISLLIVSIIYYFVEVSGYLARKYRIHKLSQSMFAKNLDDIDLMHFINTTNSTILSDNEKTTLPVSTNDTRQNGLVNDNSNNTQIN